MHWWQFTLLGAAGGTLAEFLSLFKYVAAWQDARRAPSGSLRTRRAALSRFIDVPAHAWMLVLRGLLGAASAGVFAAGDQIKGAFAAIALGFCGPAMLERLGQSPIVDSLVHGRGPALQSAAADAAAVSIKQAALERRASEGQPEVLREH